MMNVSRILFFFIFLSLAKFSFASDTIIVHKDPRLDILSQKQAQINKHSLMMTSNGQYKGFRVQLASTSSRDDAFKMKTDLLLKFPDEKAYVIFQSPYFKVRIGNFLKKDDAEKFRKQYAKLLPQGVYIVEDAIDYTPTEEELNQ